MAVSRAEYRRMLQGLLPRGAAWPRASDAVLTRLLEGWAEELARADGRAADLLAEADPRTASELLAEWEEDWGLTGEGSPTDRRAALLAAMTAEGGVSAAFFIALAAEAGVTITVTTYRPFQVGRSTAGDALSNGDWRFAWEVNPGGLNTALRFDGVDDYVDLGTDLGDPQQYTVMFWQNLKLPDSPGEAIVGHGGDLWISWELFVGGTARVAHYVPGTAFTPLLVTTPVSTWVHVACTYDQSTRRIYLDGVEAESDTPGASAVAIDPVTLGPTTGEVEGRLTDFRVYDHALTPAEIADIYQAQQRATGSEAGLVGYWPLNDGEGTTARDLAGGNDGTLVNGPVWEISGPTATPAALRAALETLFTRLKPSDSIVLFDWSS